MAKISPTESIRFLSPFSAAVLAAHIRFLSSADGPPSLAVCSVLNVFVLPSVAKRNPTESIAFCLPLQPPSWRRTFAFCHLLMDRRPWRFFLFRPVFAICTVGFLCRKSKMRVREEKQKGCGRLARFARERKRPRSDSYYLARLQQPCLFW